MSAEEPSLVVADASSIFWRVRDVVGKNVPELGEVGTFDIDASPIESLQANVAKKTSEKVVNVVSEQHPEALGGEKRRDGIVKRLSKRLSKTSFDDGSIHTGASTPSSSGKSRNNLVKRINSRLKKKNKVKTASNTTLRETSDASQVNKADKPSDSEGPAKDHPQTIEILKEKGEAATAADPLEPSGSKLEGAEAQAKETVDGLVDRSLPTSSSMPEGEMVAYKEIEGVFLLDMAFTRRPAPYEMPAAVERPLSLPLSMFILLLVLLGTVFSHAPPDFLPTSLRIFQQRIPNYPSPIQGRNGLELKGGGRKIKTRIF